MTWAGKLVNCGTSYALNVTTNCGGAMLKATVVISGMTELIIFGPPEPPKTMTKSPHLFLEEGLIPPKLRKTIVGLIEDSGYFENQG